MTDNTASVSAVTDENFATDVLAASSPVLVDFWAEWCGPCKAIAPIVEAVAKDYAGRVKVCKMDVDGNQNTAAEYGIRGIPTLMLFNKGQLVKSHTGSGLSQSELAAFIDSALEGPQQATG